MHVRDYTLVSGMMATHLDCSVFQAMVVKLQVRLDQPVVLAAVG